MLMMSISLPDSSSIIGNKMLVVNDVRAQTRQSLYNIKNNGKLFKHMIYSDNAKYPRDVIVRNVMIQAFTQ